MSIRKGVNKLKGDNKMKKNRRIFVHKVGSADKIGELTGQAFRLRNLLFDEGVNICILTFPVDHKKRINKATYNIVLRGINIIHTTNSKLIYKPLRDNPCLVYDKDNIYPIWYDNDNILKIFCKKYSEKKIDYHFSLTDLENRMGNKLREEFQIPTNAKIVTLVVRESGYTSSDGVYNFRDASIENYIPAVNYLIDQGFYVVRLGDKSMKRIKNTPSQFIDAPFHPNYTDLVDPYFISKSKFFFGCGTGPMELASGFGIPILATDLPIISQSIVLDKKSLVIYKKLYSRKLKRNLTYEEILMSPCIEFFDDKYYQEADIEVVPNTPEEIMLATKEMNERLDEKDFSSKDINKVNQRVKNIHEKAICIYKNKQYIKEYLPNEHIKISYLPYYCTFLSKCQISLEYTKLNPDFLGHDWSNFN